MKYEVISVCPLQAQLPDWSVGMDRLTWYSPAPGMRELLEQSVADGGISRYVEDDDRLVVGSDTKTLHTVYLRLADAQAVVDLIAETAIPNFVHSVELSERPDL